MIFVQLKRQKQFTTILTFFFRDDNDDDDTKNKSKNQNNVLHTTCVVCTFIIQFKIIVWELNVSHTRK